MAYGEKELNEWRTNHVLLTRKQAMKAFCCDCMGLYKDSVKDCGNMNCPMYPYQPYSTYNEKRQETKHD